MRVFGKLFVLSALALTAIVEAAPVDNEADAVAQLENVFKRIPKGKGSGNNGGGGGGGATTNKDPGTTTDTQTTKTTSTTETTPTTTKASTTSKTASSTTSTSKSDSTKSTSSISSSKVSASDSAAASKSSSRSISASAKSSDLTSSSAVPSSHSSSHIVSSTSSGSASSASLKSSLPSNGLSATSTSSGISSAGRSLVSPSSSSSMAPVESIASCPLTAKRSRTYQARAINFQAKKESDGSIGTFIATDRLGAGSWGEVFDVQEDCNAVAKRLTQDSMDDEEIQNLRKVNELIAYSGAGRKKGDWIVMKKIVGTQLQQTDAYKAAKGVKSQRSDIVDKALSLIQDKASDYLDKYGVMHGDLGNTDNVLFTESGGNLNGANLVDWGNAYENFPKEELQGYMDQIKSSWEIAYVDKAA